jgi:hypothetical protein
MVHGSALLVIFSSLSSRLEFEIPAHSYFVSSFDTAPATIFQLKKNRSCYSCNKQYPKTPNFTSGSHHECRMHSSYASIAAGMIVDLSKMG